MFSNPRPNLYESSEGFSVEVLALFQVLYRDGGRCMLFESEPVGGGTMTLYLPRRAKWAPPYDSEAVEDQELALVVNNISRAFLSQGLKIEVG